MEKMLDKKSRDFAKNMQDTMIYDKDKNEVQIGTKLNVDGKVSANILESNEYIRPKNTDEQINVSPDFLGIAKTIGAADADVTVGVTSGSGSIVFDFAKARVSNGKLNIAIGGHITTNSEKLVVGARARLPYWQINLPATILSKIFPIDGGLYNVVLGGKTYCYIASSGSVPPNSNVIKDNAIYYTITKGDVYITLDMALSNITFEANKTYSFRFETNLIL